MYRCELCQWVVEPSTPASRIVVETREVDYPYRKEAYTRRVKGRLKKFDDLGGHGVEIVKEILVCPGCAGKCRTRHV